MLTYGVKINTYEAGSVYAVSRGCRKNYDYKASMLTNSLFTDFILANGLRVHKETSSRDIISINFNYGSRSFGEEMQHLNAALERCAGTDKESFILQLIEDAKANEDKFDKKTADQIREIFYRDGVTIQYGKQSIHYKMLYRTPGKAKKGSCVFICDRLYKRARNFLYMGIKLPKKNAPIVEIGAYSSLVTSTIVDRIRIDPHNILILDDVDSSFFTRAVSIEIDEQKQCHAVRKDNYEVTNTLFDGQALIDLSIFPEWGDGYILLRHHFTKMAAFAADIQLFFRDYFGANYDTAVVRDVWGNEHLAKDIKLITTVNAIKWIKFSISYEYWCEKVAENDCMFGIVKTAHPSKFGDVQRMSYQMVNALDANTIEPVLSKSLAYIERLKTDIGEFINYLRKNSNFANDFDALVALYEQNPEFERSDYFRERRTVIIRSYLWNLKNGKVIQNADNLTIVGSPYAMLLHSVGGNVEDDPTFNVESGCIQCYTERFDDGEYLAEFRNPFNGQGNLGYLHNHYHPYFEKYFRIGRLCVAVNMIHTDFQDRNNGSDMDSDSIYVTNQNEIVAHAKMCYRDFPTIVNNIPKESNSYNNTPEDFARVDNALAASQRAIGESSNLAQLALTYDATYGGSKYKDYVCILSVLAQCAIDNAKRTFDINIPEEIKRLKKEMDVKENGYPFFWLVIRRGFNREKINPRLRCPMNHIYNLRTREVHSSTPTLPISHFFVPHKLEMPKRTSRKVEEIIQKYSIHIMNYNTDDDQESDDYLLLRNNFAEMIEDIRRCSLPEKYIGLFSWLLNRAFNMTKAVASQESKTLLHKNRSLLIKTLYETNTSAFLHCFSNKN